VRKLFGLSFIFALFMSVVTVSAQDDVFQVTYGETVNLTSNADGQQFFFQFEGVAGDLVYFTGVGEDAGGARFLYEIRDSVGRSVGVTEDFPIDAFTIAELPSDGLYTAVATSDASYSQTVDFTVQRTHFISADAVNVSVTVEGAPQVLGMRVDQDGEYNLLIDRLDNGSLAFDLDIRDYSSGSGRRFIDFYGDKIQRWTTTVNLTTSAFYVVKLENGVSSLSSLQGGSPTSDYAISLRANR
jgi:hypothetical protein